MKTTYVTDPAKTARQLRTALTQHTEAVTGFLARLDVLMKRQSTEQRGKDIAALSNVLEMANDSVRYSVLGIDFRTDKKPARRAADEIERLHALLDQTLACNMSPALREKIRTALSTTEPT